MLVANRDRKFILPVYFPNNTKQIAIPSLALGGAEKIVLDWAKAEAAKGIKVEIAVIYNLKDEWTIPNGVTILRRRKDINPERFIELICDRWNDKVAVSTHLVRDHLLAKFWERGFKTIHTFHNGKTGWKNDPSGWVKKNVPAIIGCSESVRDEIQLELINDIPVHVVKHQASISKNAYSFSKRKEIRDQLSIPDDALLIGAIGSFKNQKNYQRAIRILNKLNQTKDAHLCVLGGLMNLESINEYYFCGKNAIELDIKRKLITPGFVSPSDKYLSAFDVVLNTSFHEGYSIATQEALLAGLDVIATNVDGQNEITIKGLNLINPSLDDDAFVEQLKQYSPRGSLEPRLLPRGDRQWSPAHTWAEPTAPIDTLFITANLNSGGAQRSLVNLAKESQANSENFAIAVCNGVTNDYFSKELLKHKIAAFHPCRENDVFAISTSILTLIQRHSVRTVCLWNVDPKIKLLLSKFLSKTIRYIDVSPGAYATEEMNNINEFQELINHTTQDFLARIDHMVFKHAQGLEGLVEVKDKHSVIQNGVEELPKARVSTDPIKLAVCGRITPSKQLTKIIFAFSSYLSAYPNSELIVYGQAEAKDQDYLDEVLTLAKHLPITFKGHCADLSSFSGNLTATIVLGTNQGCPNTVLESFAAGIPVIANDSGGTCEFVKTGETGILINENASAQELKRALLQLVSQPNLQEMSSNCQRLVRENNSVATMYENYKEIIF